MNKLIVLLCGSLILATSLACAGQAYMERFNTYSSLSQKLPLVPTPIFLEFVQGTTPLSNKLRERWLYELARLKDWKSYNQYYQSSKDINLVCYEHIAKYTIADPQEAMNAATSLWLTGNSMPPACNHLFNLLIKDKGFNQDLIGQRIALALDRRNIQLALYLLTLFKTPHLLEAQALNSVYQNPKNISKLPAGGLNGDIYLYGLKRMVSMNMDKAITLWRQSKTQLLLNAAQKQNFLAHLVLYKAMRTHEDTEEWFNQIDPHYYSDILLDWQIRFALKRQNWSQVSTLISDSKNKETPCWQYWLARALEEQGKIKEAKALYEPLAKNRHYYGFLASLRLKQDPHFINEVPIKNPDVLKPYQAFTNQINALYASKNTRQASGLLNDFMSELPKDEASALVYWIDTTLKWYEKSVYLSNNDLLNNQLSLRFPLPYKEVIKGYSKKYGISPELIYAMIRQESGFREDVTSSAGARGLMQLVPYTAGVVSKENKIAYSNQSQLFLPEKNIHIGVAYLKQLSKRFSNHPILIAAAYNAGPKQVVYWLKTHPPKEIDVWIETLPWQETRNYLKNIMAFYVVYQYRLNQHPHLETFFSHL
jgi:soluble lytic murein transglycosylase